MQKAIKLGTNFIWLSFYTHFFLVPFSASLFFWLIIRLPESLLEFLMNNWIKNEQCVKKRTHFPKSKKKMVVFGTYKSTIPLASEHYFSSRSDYFAYKWCCMSVSLGLKCIPHVLHKILFNFAYAIFEANHIHHNHNNAMYPVIPYLHNKSEFAQVLSLALPSSCPAECEVIVWRVCVSVCVVVCVYDWTLFSLTGSENLRRNYNINMRL